MNTLRVLAACLSLTAALPASAASLQPDPGFKSIVCLDPNFQAKAPFWFSAEVKQIQDRPQLLITAGNVIPCTPDLGCAVYRKDVFTGYTDQWSINVPTSTFTLSGPIKAIKLTFEGNTGRGQISAPVMFDPVTGGRAIKVVDYPVICSITK